MVIATVRMAGMGEYVQTMDRQAEAVVSPEVIGSVVAIVVAS
jgi:hypothetical protein